MRETPKIGSGQIELIMVAQPAPGMTVDDLGEIWTSLNNPIVEITDKGIISVHQVEKFDVEAEDGTLVWACDFCGCYSILKTVVDRHEQICPERNN